MPGRRFCPAVLDVCGDKIGNHRFNYNLRIESRNLTSGGDCLGQRLGCIGFIEQGLSLQIARLDVVAIDDANGAHAGAGQQGGQGGAGGAASDQGDPGSGQLLLSFTSDSREEHLPRISFFQVQRDHQFQGYKPLL